MIYLIGGAPRVGKSLMAEAVAGATKAVKISTDDLCDKVTALLSEKERAEKFPLPSFSGDALENTLNPEERVRLQIISARSLESEIDQIIDHAIVKGDELVLEGVHLLPDHVRALVEKHGSNAVTAVFVGSENIDLVVEGIQKNTNVNNWLKESDEAVIRQVAEFVAAFSIWIQGEAKHHSFIYMERTKDFEGDVERCKELL